MDQREWKGLRTYALYCIAAAALLAVVFLFYFNRTKLNIQEQAEAQLTEVTRQYANAIKTDMRGNIQAVEALAHVFGELGQSNPETIIPLITSIAGTLGGVLFLAIIDNGLNLMGLNYLVKDALVGVILVVALALSFWQARLRQTHR